MQVLLAKHALDKIITKARVHLYKPIQIAEILYRDRIHNDIDLSNLETYRKFSKRWRDKICGQFLGRVSTSSARYQDDVFNENAMPPTLLNILGQENRTNKGVVEAYIYSKFLERQTQMSTGLQYCVTKDKTTFNLEEFLLLFWSEPGLRRSIDKVYEIIVYALFAAIVDALDITVKVSSNPEKTEILKEFEDFAYRVIRLSVEQPNVELRARINRVGVTNASDRGLDMWANFGLAIQIKHLSLTEELAESIVGSVTADRIVIVCKDSEEKVIVSLLTQIGWKSRIQSIITESDLIHWYEKALRGRFESEISMSLLNNLIAEIQLEFPTSHNQKFMQFYHERGYSNVCVDTWLGEISSSETLF